jgi:hypothetical protein
LLTALKRSLKMLTYEELREDDYILQFGTEMANVVEKNGKFHIW